MYASTDPLIVAVWLCVVLAFICWLLSIVTREYSWVDRIWSITPAIYALHFAAHAGFSNTRLNLMAALTVLWGARLTYNFARKGGYAPGGEDYRWVEVQNKIGPFWFQVLNTTFIAPYQNALLLLITLPSYIAYQHQAMPLNMLDCLAAGAFLFFLLGETIADQQQWRFYQSRAAAKERGQAHPQFLTQGLFRYSRHPNFFCEQAMWWSFYFFSVTAGASWLNWTISGALLLSLLFQSSTSLTEKITLRKYPEYAEYQQRTSRLIPWP